MRNLQFVFGDEGDEWLHMYACIYEYMCMNECLCICLAIPISFSQCVCVCVWKRFLLLFDWNYILHIHIQDSFTHCTRCIVNKKKMKRREWASRNKCNRTKCHVNTIYNRPKKWNNFLYVFFWWINMNLSFDCGG